MILHFLKPYKNRFVLLVSILVVGMVLFLIYTRVVLAATITWDGGGTEVNCLGTSNNWSCQYNWSTDTVSTTTDESPNGFTIQFSTPQSKDLELSWIAMRFKN